MSTGTCSSAVDAQGHQREHPHVKHEPLAVFAVILRRHSPRPHRHRERKAHGTTEPTPGQYGGFLGLEAVP